MPSALAEYEKLVELYERDRLVAAGQMFGKPCLKVSSKAFVAQHKDTVVFKLSGLHHQKAAAKPGAVLWDPSGKGRPMKEWVALPVTASRSYKGFAAAARDYVAGAA